MKHALTEREKIFIIQHYETKSLGRIGELLNVNPMTVFYFYKRWKDRQTIINRKSTGRKKILGNNLTY